MRLTSQVIITNDIESTIKKLESLITNESIIQIIKEDNFLVEDAKLAIEKAYIASENKTIIILSGKSFSDVVQNKLLKVIEEPPKNKEFILITPNRATILDTIRSRLPITILASTQTENALSLDLTQLSLPSVYMFIQNHRRTNTKEMKIIIEEITKQAINSQQYNLDEKSLELCSNAIIALDIGSPPQFVLNALLLKLLARMKR
ncbi:MAG: DNA polymerase III subunit delta' [Sulfurovum sp.]